jgi:hypothetical protein
VRNREYSSIRLLFANIDTILFLDYLTSEDCELLQTPMIKIVQSKIFITLIAGVFLSFTIGQAREMPQQQAADRVSIAILSFASGDLQKEEMNQLTADFRAALQSTGGFTIQSEGEMDSLLTEGHFSNIAGCNYTICLSEAGKMLGVLKVLRVDMKKQGDLFTTHIKIIQTYDASILFDKVFNHTGTLDSYRHIAIPEQTRAVADSQVGKSSSWLIPAVAIVLASGIIYLVYKTLTSEPSSEGSGNGGVATPQ